MKKRFKKTDSNIENLCVFVGEIYLYDMCSMK